ncbi:MAG: Tex family protein [Bacteroidota bacterium]
MNPNHLRIITQQTGLQTNQVLSVAKLLEEGATIPFIARYRKERTGSMDEVQLMDVKNQIQKLDDLDKRKATILKAIEEQGKLTDNLKKIIEGTFNATALEDIYLPYKKKRKTRASVAREKGLEPLAKKIFQEQGGDPDDWAATFLNDEVESPAEALQGARDIIAEWINEDQKVRNKVRQVFQRQAVIKSKVARGKDEEGAKYRDYFDFSEPLNKCPSHRLLAMRRGEEEGFLRVSIQPESEDVLYQMEKLLLKADNKATDQLVEAMEDSYKRLLEPSIETEFRNLAKEKADAEAIEVFTTNLRQLLLAAPLGQCRVVGIDPGYRTGCKVVVIDQNGDLLENTTIFPHPPQSRSRDAIQTIQHLVHKYRAEALAIGNGTAGRETLSLFRDAKLEGQPQLFLVNESGASIYSASEVAREEFPDHDVTVRGAVSIGRRLMDPLAELVKIDPKSIGVGQYQHDVNQTRLKESLQGVVESCVNTVGINLNTASKHLLTYVSGLGPTLAQNIVDYRSEKGQFSSRKELMKVPRMGAKAFEQCAGFLRVREGKNSLDNTSVHPERYQLVESMAKDLSVSLEDLIASKDLRGQIKLDRYITEEVGRPTLLDILQELEKPGLDPRGEAQAFEFAKEVSKMEDLQVGMVLPGIVTNITNFGAFVDVGVKQDGLVHISQLANRFVKNPMDVVQLQQKVKVRVVDVDLSRKRIQLSMKNV